MGASNRFWGWRETQVSIISEFILAQFKTFENLSSFIIRNYLSNDTQWVSNINVVQGIVCENIMGRTHKYEYEYIYIKEARVVSFMPPMAPCSSGWLFPCFGWYTGDQFQWSWHLVLQVDSSLVLDSIPETSFNGYVTLFFVIDSSFVLDRFSYWDECVGGPGGDSLRQSVQKTGETGGRGGGGGGWRYGNAVIATATHPVVGSSTLVWEGSKTVIKNMIKVSLVTGLFFFSWGSRICLIRHALGEKYCVSIDRVSHYSVKNIVNCLIGMRIKVE